MANGSRTRPPHIRVTRIRTTRASDSKDLQDLLYWYDAVGNITLQKDNAWQPVFYANSVADPKNDYTYDTLYRLIQAEGRELAGNNGAVTNSDSSRSGNGNIPYPNNTSVPLTDAAAMRRYIQYYTYDEVGNMLSMQHTNTSGSGNWTRNFTIDSNSNQLTGSSIGSNGSSTDTYAYDARGNMIGGMNHLNAGSTSLVYNAENRLESVVITASITAYYQYDGSGQRVRKTIVNTAASITEKRIYLGEWELYTKFVSSSLTTKRESLHVSDDTGRILMIDSPLSPTTGESQLQRYTYSNHLGTATLELDDAAAIISYEEYYPFGSTSFQSGRSTAEVSLKRYRYTGKERDEETGLYYHGARYYISWLARWSASDPINSEVYNCGKGNPDKNTKRHATELTASSYEYCYDNPVRFSDPTGEQVPFVKTTEASVIPLVPKILDHVNRKDLMIEIIKDKSTMGNLSSKEFKSVVTAVGEIFKKNGIDIKISGNENSNGSGDKKYEMWKEGKLPINQSVIKLVYKEDSSLNVENPGKTLGWFEGMSNNPKLPNNSISKYDIVGAVYSHTKTLSNPVESQESKTNQISVGTAHEIIHYLINAASKHFNIENFEGILNLGEMLGMNDGGHINGTSNIMNESFTLWGKLEEGASKILPNVKVVLDAFNKDLQTGGVNHEKIKKELIANLNKFKNETTH